MISIKKENVNLATVSLGIHLKSSKQQGAQALEGLLTLGPVSPRPSSVAIVAQVSISLE